MLRYFITDRHLAWAVAGSGADYVQVRDKSLCTRDLIHLVQRVQSTSRAKVLVNDRIDIALLTGADGVHLRSHSIAPSRLRSIAPAGFLIGVSCHSATEVVVAEQEGADFAVLGPIFPTPSKAAFGDPIGLRPLHEAAHSVAIPVLALGGVTRENTQACLRAGAAGVAGIRLFTASDTSGRNEFRVGPPEFF